VNMGAGALGSVPILHYRSYNDAIGDIHDRFRDFQIRERLLKANGRADNQVIWIYGGREQAEMVAELALDTMTEWLDALQADRADVAAIDKVVRAKPAAAADACWDLQGKRIDEELAYINKGLSKGLSEGLAQGQCNTLYPIHTNPRLAAGAPLADDAIKCALKPAQRSDYPADLNDAQWTQLQSVFAEGVCDYSKPGVNQAPPAGTYLHLPL
jgi:hypothetical protein